MDNLSADVGHKMKVKIIEFLFAFLQMFILSQYKKQSAVKAKLIEMGTGGPNGHIDDELPDYVMIMVANKRTKRQMTADLSLFMGDNTAQFVDWLYLVLEKLQEVAIPATATVFTADSLNSSVSGRPATGTMQEGRRSDKTYNKKSRRDDDIADDPTSRKTRPQHTSITDVFAEHVMQTAHSSLVSNASLKNEDTMDTNAPAASEPERTLVPTTRRKEISELADLLTKINHAKKQLNNGTGCESDDTGGEDDDDFISLNDEESAVNKVNNGHIDSGTADETPTTSGTNADDDVAAEKRRSARVPITFCEDEIADDDVDDDEFVAPASTDAAVASSVRNRLGFRCRTDDDERSTTPSPTPAANTSRRNVEDEPSFRNLVDDRRQPDRNGNNREPPQSRSVARKQRDNVFAEQRNQRDRIDAQRRHQSERSREPVHSSRDTNYNGCDQNHEVRRRDTDQRNQRDRVRETERNPRRQPPIRNPFMPERTTDRRITDSDRERAQRDREREILRRRERDRAGAVASDVRDRDRIRRADRSREHHSSPMRSNNNRPNMNGTRLRDRIGPPSSPPARSTNSYSRARRLSNDKDRSRSSSLKKSIISSRREATFNDSKAEITRKTAAVDKDRQPRIKSLLLRAMEEAEKSTETSQKSKRAEEQTSKSLRNKSNILIQVKTELPSPPSKAQSTRRAESGRSRRTS